MGDPFDIDYVAHEMGHQFGANHTQNNNCQRESSASVEPGSGSTIMGYAGICEPNVQNNSDAYFHGLNLGEIASFVVAGNGNTCAVRSSDGNSKPLVTVQKNAYTIPASTPFALSATGTDADGDILTYCWEQIDPEVTTMPPTATSTKGPAFRSVKPSTHPTRCFPDLVKKYGQWESLPTVSRILDFRCTVRDNHSGLGCTDETDVRVATTSAAGPFVVNNPNTSTVVWPTGSKQTVTWNVMNGFGSANTTSYYWDISDGTDDYFYDEANLTTAFPQGNWTIQLQTDGSCKTALSPIYNLTVNPPLNVSFAITDDNCIAADGGFVITVSGGDGGAYSYSINSGATFAPGWTYTGLVAGDYTVITMDNNNCIDTSIATVGTLNAFAPTITPDATVMPG